MPLYPKLEPPLDRSGLQTSPVQTSPVHLHHILWGNNLDEMLQSLGNGSGLKYLPTEVKRLGLREFGYQGDILLIREEYTTAFESLHLGSPTSGEPSAIIIGQPGIGACYLQIVVVL